MAEQSHEDWDPATIWNALDGEPGKLTLEQLVGDIDAQCMPFMNALAAAEGGPAAQADSAEGKASANDDAWDGEPPAKMQASAKLDSASAKAKATREKATREKQRRAQLNCRYVELASLIDPGKAKSDRNLILEDAVRVITQLRAENNQLKQLNKFLEEKVQHHESRRSQSLYQQSLAMQGGLGMPGPSSLMHSTLGAGAQVGTSQHGNADGAGCSASAPVAAAAPPAVAAPSSSAAEGSLRDLSRPGPLPGRVEQSEAAASVPPAVPPTATSPALPQPAAAPALMNAGAMTTDQALALQMMNMAMKLLQKGEGEQGACAPAAAAAPGVSMRPASQPSMAVKAEGKEQGSGRDAGPAGAHPAVAEGAQSKSVNMNTVAALSAAGFSFPPMGGMPVGWPPAEMVDTTLDSKLRPPAA